MTLETKIYNVALNEGVDYDAFWNEIESNNIGTEFVPTRAVTIANERLTSLRQCWYELTDTEAETLRKDPRVFCVEIPPEHRTDIKIVHCASFTGTYSKTSGTPNSNWVNWGLFRTNSSTNNTPNSSGTLSYDYPLDGTGVDVVIQDSGLQIDHPEFTDANGVSRVQQIDWYAASGVTGTMPSFSEFYSDYDGHGTHVGGIAAGKTYGRAKNSNIYVMTIGDLVSSPTVGISITDCFDCIKGWHLNKPVDPTTGYKRPTVVNMSWSTINTFSSIKSITYQGYIYNNPTSSQKSTYGLIGAYSPQYGANVFGYRVPSIEVDVAELLDAGVVLVGAAGNFYQTNDVSTGPDYNNFFTKTDDTTHYYMRGGTPGNCSGVICVGAVDAYTNMGQEQKLAYSDSGPRVDVYAPGTFIVSSMSTANKGYYTNTYPYDSNYLIANVSGTSMASPQIVGIVAQLLQVYPTATPAQIRQKIIDMSVSDLLYTTGYTYDYSNSTSLHGSPNRYAFQAFNTNASSGVSGPVALNNIKIPS